MEWIQKYQQQYAVNMDFANLVFSWDGRYLIGVQVRSPNGGFFVWDVEEYFAFSHIPLDMSSVQCMVSSPHGLLTLGIQRFNRLVLSLYDWERWEQEYEMEWPLENYKAHSRGMSLNPQNPDQVAVTVEKSIHIWDIPERTILKSFEGWEYFTQVLYTNTYIIGKTPSQLLVWDIETGVQERLIPHPNWYGGLAATHDPDQIIVSTSEARSAQLDLLSGAIERTFDGGGNVVSHLPTKTLGVGSLNFLNVYDLERGDLVHGQLMAGYIQNIAMSDDGQWLAANGGSSRLRCWQRIAPADKYYALFTSDDWFERAVVALREQGFFRDLEGVPETELVQTVRERFLNEGVRISAKLNSPLDLVQILAQDKQSVWWDDLEADVGPTNKVYERVLAEWASISRGSFVPTAIAETWNLSDADYGPTVTFAFRNQQIELHPTYHSDYIDISILRSLNALIVDTPIRFEVYETFDQTAVVFALTVEQKNCLMYNLSFNFVDCGGHSI